jgi:hypothetical protein
MPMLPFIDYQVPALSGTFTLNNDQLSPATIVSYNTVSIKSLTLDYSIIRGSTTEVGRIMIATDGSTLNFEVDKANNSDTGVALMGSLSMGNILVQYISNNTGQSAAFRYTQTTLN